MSNVMHDHDAMIAKLELIAKVKNALHSNVHAFGIFYNSLMHSNNTDAAKMLLPLIYRNDLETIGNEKRYKNSDMKE
jgi:hypothetical protein